MRISVRSGDALADDLVAGGERDQVREALEGHAVAGPHEPCDGVGECRELAHASNGAPA